MLTPPRHHGPAVTTRAEVLFVGGCAGVGKTSVAAEMHAQLSVDRARHCLIEGDNLDLAWPVPWEQGLTLAEANLAAMWRNYQAAGYSRLIYTNTAAVYGAVIDSLLEALGADPVVHAVLLTAGADTVASRLAGREIGSALGWHVERSRRAAVALEAAAPPWVHRVDTDGRTVIDIARGIRELVRWSPLPMDR